MKKFLTISLFFIGCLFVTAMVTANDFSEEKEVKIFQISFEQDVNRNFNDLLLIKTNGFLKYQWEPEGLYIVMETEVTKEQVFEVLKQLNFASSFKLNKLQNRILPTKLFKN